MCKYVLVGRLLCGSRGDQSTTRMCVFMFIEAVSWQSKQMYACHSLIRHICHCHDETVCLRKPPRDFQRYIWVTLVLTSAICALSFGIWLVYIQQEVTNMHYTWVICPHYMLWETPANSLTLCTFISPDWHPSRPSHWFITSFDLPCHKVKTLALCLDRQIILALILCLRGQKGQLRWTGVAKVWIDWLEKPVASVFTIYKNTVMFFLRL